MKLEARHLLLGIVCSLALHLSLALGLSIWDSPSTAAVNRQSTIMTVAFSSASASDIGQQAQPAQETVEPTVQEVEQIIEPSTLQHERIEPMRQPTEDLLIAQTPQRPPVNDLPIPTPTNSSKPQEYTLAAAFPRLEDGLPILDMLDQPRPSDLPQASQQQLPGAQPQAVSEQVPTRAKSPSHSDQNQPVENNITAQPPSITKQQPVTTPTPEQPQQLRVDAGSNHVSEMPAETDHNTFSQDGQAVADYRQLVKDILRRNKVYPRQARRFGKEGQVPVTFVVASDGSIKNIKLGSSRSDVIFKRAVLKLIRQASPLPQPPTGSMTLTFTVDYRLTDH